MYTSKHYTCEQIDQRLLQGYYDDVVEAGYNGTFEKFQEDLLAALGISANGLNAGDVIIPPGTGLESSELEAALAEIVTKSNRTNQTLGETVQALSETQQTLNETNQTLNETQQTLNETNQTLNETNQSLQENIQHTTAIGEAIILGQDEHGSDVKPSDVFEASQNDTYVEVVTDSEGHFLEGIRRDGTKVFGAPIEAPNIVQQKEALEQTSQNTAKNTEDIEALQENLEQTANQLQGNLDQAVEQQDEVNAKSVLGKAGGKDVYPADVTKVTFGNGFIYVITDAEDRIVFWLDHESNVNWVKGVPEPIKEYIKTHGGGNGDGGVIVPSLASNTVQDVPSILEKAPLCMYGKICGFTRCKDNPFAGYKWMADNWDISQFALAAQESLVSWNSTTHKYEEKTGDAGHNLKVMNTVMRYCNEHNIEIIATISGYPPFKGVAGTLDKEHYYALLDFYLGYDGTKDCPIIPNSPFFPDDDSTTYKCKIDTFKFFDEIEIKLNIHNTQEWLDMLSIVTTYARKERSDISIASPSSNGYIPNYHDVIGTIESDSNISSEYLPIGVTAEEVGGLYYSDLFETYTTDPWTKEVVSTNTIIMKSYAAHNPIDSYSKQFRAVSGFSPTAYDKEEQGERTLETTLLNIATGANTYCYFQPEYDQNEYPILFGKFQGAGHICCRTADDTARVILGYSYDDIVIGTGYQASNSRVKLHDHQASNVHNELFTNLKSKGLRLKKPSLPSDVTTVASLHVTSVAIREKDASTDKTVLWTGDQDIYSTPLVLDKSLFAGLVTNDEIIIETDAPRVSTPDTPITLEAVEPMPAAIYLKFLCRNLHKGCSRPIIREYANFYIASWYNENNKPVYVIYRNRSKEVPTLSLVVTGNYYVTDLGGEVLSVDITSLSLEHPVYILNANNIKFL